MQLQATDLDYVLIGPHQCCVAERKTEGENKINTSGVHSSCQQSICGLEAKMPPFWKPRSNPSVEGNLHNLHNIAAPGRIYK